MTTRLFIVRLVKAAQKDLDGIPQEIRRQFVLKLRGLEKSPRSKGRKLKGSTNTYRLRQGDYRLIYEVRNAEREVIVTRVAHRSEAYRNLN